MTRVLPLPAPASTSKGPSPKVTASRCAGLRSSRRRSRPAGTSRLYRASPPQANCGASPSSPGQTAGFARAPSRAHDVRAQVCRVRHGPVEDAGPHGVTGGPALLAELLEEGVPELVGGIALALGEQLLVAGAVEEIEGGRPAHDRQDRAVEGEVGDTGPEKPAEGVDLAATVVLVEHDRDHGHAAQHVDVERLAPDLLDA